MSNVRWYLLGVFHAAMVAVYYWFTSVAVLASGQDAIGHLRGAWGEENTREELKSGQALAAQELGKNREARHRARAHAFTVRSAVVVWGALQSELGEAREIDGVHIVPGQQLVRWLRSVDGDPVPKDVALEALGKLRAYRAKAWAAATSTERRRAVADPKVGGFEARR